MDRLFQNVDDSPDPRPALVTGIIPEWLEGCLFRLGPGRWDLSEDFTLNHWLDGCALLYRLTIRNGQVTVASRFLDTEAFKKMTHVQRPVFIEFGTRSFPDPCKNVFSRFFSQIVPLELSDNSVSNIYTLEDDLYCATDTSYLWKVDKDSLKAHEKVDFKKLLSVNLASSHRHRAPDGTSYILGSSFSSGIKHHIMKMSPPAITINGHDEKTLQRMSILSTMNSNWSTSFSYCHSFGLTDHYVLFIEQPCVVNSLKAVAAGIKGYSSHDTMEWLPKEKVRFHLINRVSGEHTKSRYLADAFFLFHHVNAYEEDGYIIADIIAYEDSHVLDKLYLKNLRLGQYDLSCQPGLRRYVLPTNTAGTEGDDLVKPERYKAKAIKQNGGIFLQPQYIGESGFELPTINYKEYNTKKYRFVYGSGVFETGKYKNSIVKLNVTTEESLVWKGTDTMYPSEANFIPRPDAMDEDDGVVLSVVLDVELDAPDFLLVLDAKTFKELARAEVPCNLRLPPSVHGCFLED